MCGRSPCIHWWFRTSFEGGQGQWEHSLLVHHWLLVTLGLLSCWFAKDVVVFFLLPAHHWSVHIEVAENLPFHRKPLKGGSMLSPNSAWKTINHYKIWIACKNKMFHKYFAEDSHQESELVAAMTRDSCGSVGSALTALYYTWDTEMYWLKRYVGLT